MPKHRWSILCLRGAIDKYSNELSILLVKDELTIPPILQPLPANPVLSVELQLVSTWDRDAVQQPEKFWTSVSVTTPNGEDFLVGDSILSASLEDKVKTRLIYQFETIPYRGTGLYQFNVEVGDDPAGPFRAVAHVPLEIKTQGVGAITAASTAPEQPSEPTPSAPRKSSSRRGRARP